ncbi:MULTISPECIES: MarR family winged helix-turn-helix transcriptional regulator [Kribbella]|uniref:DNA-binding MarR family transcriptional regulator n=1 Tax=Kribbella pratensis TaxID=2512112 RepID=A0ABY2FFN2_9ACTN|nr:MULTISPECIES: MarR family transcriptional regulator [Kribbella]TDW90183.1 DNA-binding MarR family transcriptional regulator [Kribbella pratensis]TDW97905.1 DNA-binding MarR family transcriptional regulator [Kribbella sp. VKM Ac-2566]
MDEQTPTALTELPSWLLTQSASQAHRIVTESFAAGGARAYHFRLLATLVEFGPASQATLGRRSSIDRSDVVAALNELEAEGYVERSADPADGRRNVITITTAGKRQYRRLTTLVGKAQEEIFAPLSATDRTRLTTILGKLLAYHQE